MKRIRLGDLLLEHNLVDEKTLEKASLEQTKTGKKFGKTLIDMGVIKEEALLKLLATQLDVPFIDLLHYELNEHVVSLLPETLARRYRALVLTRNADGSLLVGMADPLDIYGFDELTKALNQPIKMAIICESALLSILDNVYRHSEEISQFAKQLSGELVEESQEDDFLFEQTQDGEEEAPVVKLLNTIFNDAIQAGASDIHIEPGENNLHIRMRVDGVLQENILDDKRIVSALIQRLKLRANLDISEKRLPQDGRFHIKLKGRDFDVRVSTLTTANGESVVMRLLDQSSPVVALEKLGMPKNLVEQISKLYRSPHGMLLVTGPTGSGKTTTLYSILSKLNKPESKVITVEDPVEYRLPRINQVQVNHKIDLTFSRVLRAVLRQDPDTIMVGEIRDVETAQIALRASVTGHFVLATLHTNDTISTAIRLIDMGCDGYMVASSVKGIIAQRLVRKICEHCQSDYHLEDNEKIWLEGLGFSDFDKLKVGLGCSQCNRVGYKGRMGVYELLVLDSDMLHALRQNDSAAFSKIAAKSPYFKPLSASILALLSAGKSTVFEAMRLLGQEMTEG